MAVNSSERTLLINCYSLKDELLFTENSTVNRYILNLEDMLINYFFCVPLSIILYQEFLLNFASGAKERIP